MIGIDTNVLIRYLVGDDAQQQAKAEKLFATFSPSEKGFISIISFVECIWVLESVYKQPRSNIKDGLLKLLASPRLEIQCAAAAEAALATAGAHDLSDAIIAEIGKAAGCATTKTFERKAAGLPGMSLLA